MAFVLSPISAAHRSYVELGSGVVETSSSRGLPMEQSWPLLSLPPDVPVESPVPSLVAQGSLASSQQEQHSSSTTPFAISTVVVVIGGTPSFALPRSPQRSQVFPNSRHGFRFQSSSRTVYPESTTSAPRTPSPAVEALKRLSLIQLLFSRPGNVLLGVQVRKPRSTQQEQSILRSRALQHRDGYNVVQVVDGGCSTEHARCSEVKSRGQRS